MTGTAARTVSDTAGVVERPLTRRQLRAEIILVFAVSLATL